MQQLTFTSVTENEDETHSISLFPNPADEMIILNLQASDKDRKGLIFDIVGRQQKAFELKSGQSEKVIPVDDLSPGVYMVVIVNKGSVTSKRFVKK
jgi:hypothetical protein